jgi:rSAM/selenodomain-associated transferase 2
VAVPLVSVIVPVLDEERSLPGLLACLCADARLECLVVDGGSRDRSVAIAEAHGARVVVSAPGRAAQMNAGAARARGGHLWFVHADSALGPQHIEAVARAIAGGMRWGRFDVRIDGASRWFPLIAWCMNRRSHWTGIATGDQALCVARAPFVAVGGFPAIALMEDIAISARLRRLVRPWRLRPPLGTSGRRWERGGVWPTILLMWRLRLAFFLGADPARLAERYRRPFTDA